MQETETRIKYCFLFVLYLQLSSDCSRELAIVQLVRFMITDISGLTQFPTR